MEFEDIKAAFQNRKFEGYLFETPPTAIATDVRRAAEKRQQKFDRRHLADYGIMILLILLSLVLIVFQNSLLARTGTFLIMVTLILQGRSTFRKVHMERKKRFDLPPKISLLEERKRVMDQIRQTKFQSTLYLVPSALGATLLCLSRALSEQTVLGFITGVLLGLMVFHFLQTSRVRKELLPHLDRINRELAEIDAKSS